MRIVIIRGMIIIIYADDPGVRKVLPSARIWWTRVWRNCRFGTLARSWLAVRIRRIVVCDTPALGVVLDRGNDRQNERREQYGGYVRCNGPAYMEETAT